MKHLNIPILALCAAFAVITLTACESSGSRVTPEVFTVNHNSPQIQIGEIEAQFDGFLGITGIRKYPITVFYYPREDAVCLQYKQDFLTYNQFWSRAGRAVFINGLSQYNDDYENRSLDRNGGRRALQKYGVVQGYLIWQQFAFSVRARANMNVEVGYTFRDRTPYFSINQRPAEYIDNQTRDNDRTSSTIAMLFTRAQAAELAVLFDQHFLNGAAPTGNAVQSNTRFDADDYSENITDVNNVNVDAENADTYENADTDADADDY
ncbi:MAG: hypothetical protein FWD28_08440 [Treponema sp.]|nr:hypothetical protein [Treponema sp.]